ncbi:hypothetical protein HZA86_03975 [Candidatus Uhrbacteria bacterium]|nr:hypothetical protein [Candidatus Uhrbacteria bacterium]
MRKMFIVAVLILLAPVVVVAKSTPKMLIERNPDAQELTLEDSFQSLWSNGKSVRLLGKDFSDKFGFGFGVQASMDS